MRQTKLEKFFLKHGFLISLAVSCLVSVGLLSGRIVITGSERFIFLYWNLLLAAVPLLLAWVLVKKIEKYGWTKWQQIGLSVLWLLFLPNSFYIVTDMIHLRSTLEASLFFDIILLSSFLLNGLVLGFVAVYLVHKQLVKRFSQFFSLCMVAAVFFSSSFAVYLGRFTEWNSWDVLIHPFGLLFDVSDRFVNPSRHSDTYLTTCAFFLVLFAIYLVFWSGISQLGRDKSR